MSTEVMKLQEIMTQAQVFASAWSLVGGRFDGGNAMDEAEVAKNELHQMVAEALAQPQQEPVAWRVKWPAIGGGHKWLMVDRPLMEKEGFVNEALYTSPPARKPLTDEEIETVWRSVQANDFHDCVKPFARAIEAAHGIKENT